MNLTRSSGILLHPTSLPGRFGVGDLGDEAYRFVDFLAASSQRIWQVLPLGPTGYGDSPYSSYSAFAGNTLLISPERLAEEGLLVPSDLNDTPAFPEEKVDYGKAIEFKNALLRKAFERFKHTGDTNLRFLFEDFSRRASSWLEDYALFRALKDEQQGKAWNEWESALARRNNAALATARERLRDCVDAQKFYQFLFFKQWAALKSYCHEQDIKLIGDIPIFVARDSADVWARPEEFKLDEEGNRLVVAGVPPDFFSKTGQLWGNPIYDWAQMRAEGFSWWIDRVRASLELFDIVRIDHFRGFVAAWEVPGRNKTAEHGRWVEVPGKDLFTAIKDALDNLPIIAEDLGDITPEVEALRDYFELPGMRVLQFGFSGDAKNIYLPHNYKRDVVAYTGTHDNDTTLGWFKSLAASGQGAEHRKGERRFCLDYLNSDGREVHWDFIRASLSSVADMAIIPLQDVLGLGTEARMNLPGTTEGNWSWRYKADALNVEITARLKKLTQLYGREY